MKRNALPLSLENTMKKFKYKMNIEEAFCKQDYIVYDQCVSFAPLNPPTQECSSLNWKNPVPCAKTKGNNPMYVDNDKHIESSKINYLTDRACHIYYSKAEELPVSFGFQQSKMPDTTQGLIDAFVTGKYVVKDPSKKDTKGYFYRPIEGILFIDPTVREDQVGLTAAQAVLKTLYQDTKDTIAIAAPADGLAALKALDAWTAPVTTPVVTA